MAMWKYTINSGTALREAIEDGDTIETVKCLINCYKELMKKMSNEDIAYYEYSIMDTIDTLKWYIISP